MTALLAHVPHVCLSEPLGNWRHLLAVIWDFLSLSLFSLGGGNTLLNEYHHLAVDKYCWLNSRQFADIYALAEAAPGPSSMIVGLIGILLTLHVARALGIVHGKIAETLLVRA